LLCPNVPLQLFERSRWPISTRRELPFDVGNVVTFALQDGRAKLTVIPEKDPKGLG
jgi:hypothetical protein